MILVLHSKYNVPTVRLLIAGEWSSGFLHTASTTSLSALDSFFALQQIGLDHHVETREVLFPHLAPFEEKLGR